MFENIKRITLALSDKCNLSHLHKECPAHYVKNHIFLDTYIIESVIKEASSFNYTGAFAWHLYNDPLIDKRLISLCKLVQKECPTSKGSLIWTNGELLTSDLVYQLIDAHVYSIRVSIYTQEMANRLRELALEIPHAPWAFTNYIQGFDNRMHEHPLNPPYVPCYAPISDITVHPNGSVGLCCMDWKQDVTFGNLHDEPLQHIIQRMGDDQQKLSSGQREFEVCRSCRLPRPKDPDTNHMRNSHDVVPDMLLKSKHWIDYDPRNK